MNTPIRILHVFCALDRGGVENGVMTIYREIDKTRVQFDFAMTDGRKSYFDDEVERLGGRVFYFDKGKGFLWLHRNLARIIRDNGPFAAVHSRFAYFSGFVLLSAYFLGVKQRIAHAHNNDIIKKKQLKRIIYELVCKLMLRFTPTLRLGCSKRACWHTFGKNSIRTKRAMVFKNSIQSQRFIFNEAVRHEIRINLNLRNALVIGHIGRFTWQKNHEFLLSIFQNIALLREDAILLLVGDGAMRDEIEDKVRSLELTDKVVFTGSRSDTSALYAAMDVFVMPSLCEGFPNVLLEAQTSGLPCIVSENMIPEEIKILNNFQFISLTKPAEDWADAIIKAASENIDRIDCAEAVIQAGYDVKDVAPQLVNIYWGGMQY